MAPGNLYYYFRNKEEILYVCHDYSLGLILKELKDVEQQHARRRIGRLHRLIVAFVHLFIDVLHGTAWTLEVEALSPPLLKKSSPSAIASTRAFARSSATGCASGVFARARSEAGVVRDLRGDQLDSALVRSRPGEPRRSEIA